MYKVYLISNLGVVVKLWNCREGDNGRIELTMLDDVTVFVNIL